MSDFDSDDIEVWMPNNPNLSNIDHYMYYNWEQENALKIEDMKKNPEYYFNFGFEYNDYLVLIFIYNKFVNKNA